MRLQSDPTIIYGLVGGKGRSAGPSRKSDITQPTPYNTYTIDGLPPGPIANPGRASLEAAANPARTKDLYFVADGTGGHAFCGDARSASEERRASARDRAGRMPPLLTSPRRRLSRRRQPRPPSPGREAGAAQAEAAGAGPKPKSRSDTGATAAAAMINIVSFAISSQCRLARPEPSTCARGRRSAPVADLTLSRSCVRSDVRMITRRKGIRTSEPGH